LKFTGQTAGGAASPFTTTSATALNQNVAASATISFAVTAGKAGNLTSELLTGSPSATTYSSLTVQGTTATSYNPTIYNQNLQSGRISQSSQAVNFDPALMTANVKDTIAALSLWNAANNRAGTPSLDNYSQVFAPTATAMPEPSSITLVLIAATALLLCRRYLGRAHRVRTTACAIRQSPSSLKCGPWTAGSLAGESAS
jgi:hypothetical protein